MGNRLWQPLKQVSLLYDHLGRDCTSGAFRPSFLLLNYPSFLVCLTYTYTDRPQKIKFLTHISNYLVVHESVFEQDHLP